MADYLGKDIFKLGFGLMRLPKNEDGSIDVPQTSDMVDAFIAAGGTYFDTAFVYTGSEDAIKQALVDRYPRESYTLATKLNAWLGEPDREAAKQQLYTSLERTGAGYFDFYLLHAIMRTNYETYEKYGLWDFVKEQKEKGVIKHWGFSFHADPDLLEQVLTEHPDVEFVQLQINYADWENPGTASQKCWEIARKHGVPIVVMEPLKGGALADPIPAVRQIFEEANPEAPIVSWGIRYSAGLEGIITVLSGMSSLEQMEENLSYMKDFRPLNEEEQAIIREAQRVLGESKTIPCTACRYCVEGCPKQIPIPEIFAAVNLHLGNGQMEEARQNYRAAVSEGHGASDCIQCRRCEQACPQHLPITEHLKQAAEMFIEN